MGLSSMIIRRASFRSIMKMPRIPAILTERWICRQRDPISRWLIRQLVKSPLRASDHPISWLASTISSYLTPNSTMSREWVRDGWVRPAYRAKRTRLLTIRCTSEVKKKDNTSLILPTVSHATVRWPLSYRLGSPLVLLRLPSRPSKPSTTETMAIAS